VSIRHSSKGKGKLIIKYNSLDELDGILLHLIGPEESEGDGSV
jgi:ParB family chromosome partitioning protein